MGIIISAKLKIRDVPKNRILYIIEYNYLRNAAEDCPGILKTKPLAVEFVDAKTLKNLDLGFSKDTRGLLFIEYDSNITSAKKHIKYFAAGKIKKRTTSEREIRRWWRLRDLSLHYSLKSINLKDRVPQIIEDAAVPVKNLVCLFGIIENINQKFNTDTITYGHAGNGNIHVRLQADRQDPKNIKKIAKYYFKQIMRLGGTISGEHGDGLARTEFVKIQYGQENYQIFKQLKDIFDPHNILNPGKVISQKSTMIQNLEKLS